MGLLVYSLILRVYYLFSHVTWQKMKPLAALAWFWTQSLTGSQIQSTLHFIFVLFMLHRDVYLMFEHGFDFEITLLKIFYV